MACAYYAAQVVDPDCNGYRLPTEAEWEYAARAGSTTEYLSGDEPYGMDRYTYVFGGRPQPVNAHPFQGRSPVAGNCPNAWGLYDMQGGVPEWTNDMISGEPGQGWRLIPWAFDDGAVDPRRTGDPILFDPISDPPNFVSVAEGDDLPYIVVKGYGGISDDLTDLRSSMARAARPDQVYGFRVVRTAYEVME